MKILEEDLEYIHDAIKAHQKKLYGSRILITGCGGFLGFYLLNYFLKYANELNILNITGVDNFILGRPKWIDELINKYKDILSIKNSDICELNLKRLENSELITHVIHAASIASPSFYRKYPIKTIEANIWGLKNLLDYYKKINLKGFLFFSSSEIYGDPNSKNIPTSEEYRGNVSVIGPRSCYDESKRFGETICYVFNKQYKMPITIVRPFNNYGPGMNINDKRVPADFAKSIINKEDINLLSDGSPTRSFCYVSDAIVGYLLCLLHGKFDVFNIGSGYPEISILELANIYKEISFNLFNFKPKVKHAISSDKDYMVDNPNRRCPSIYKAKNLLGFNPKINIHNGVERYLKFLIEKNV